MRLSSTIRMKTSESNSETESDIYQMPMENAMRNND